MDKIIMGISELAKESGLARRRIHFYVSEGLIPSPDKPGGGARYDEEHLLRLLLIQELQKKHYKLSAIREQLDAELVGKTEDQIHTRLQVVRAAVKGIEPRGGVQDLASYLNSTYPKVIASSQDRQPTLTQDFQQEKSTPLSKDFSFAELVRPAPPNANPQQASHSAASPQLQDQIDLRGVSWIKFSPQEGIDVQVREDVLRKNRRQILMWLSECASTNARGDSHED